MAAPSRPPNCQQYGVARRCYGCSRKLVVKDEMALWFVGLPKQAVFAACCFHLATAWGTTF